MRVTTAMSSTQLLRNLRNNNTALLDWQNKLSTGQRISKPGDDPVGVGYQMRYSTELARNEQYLANAKTGYGWLSQTDSVLQQATSILQRLNTITNQASNGTITPEVREQIRLEVLQLREQMVTVGNSTYDGRHIFNGQKTDIKPYSTEFNEATGISAAANQSTDTGIYYLNVSPSVQVAVSIPGEEVFGEAGADDNVFKLFDDIARQLKDDDQEGITNSLSNVLGAIERMSKNLAEVGARMNRFELVESRIEDEKLSLTKLRSSVADVDFAEAIVQLQLKQNVLQAALSTGAKVQKMTLLDYL